MPLVKLISWPAIPVAFTNGVFPPHCFYEMKYIQSDLLDELNTEFACLETSDSKIDGRIEAYSCTEYLSKH